jgi:hypothetical protein
MTPTRGVIYVAVGDSSYRRMAADSIASLLCSGYRGPIAVVCDDPSAIDPGPRTGWAADVRTILVPPPRDGGRFDSRAVKTQLHRHCPFDQALYLDCDTLIVWPIDAIWGLLDARGGGADVALAIDHHPTLARALEAAPRERRGSPQEWELTRRSVADAATTPFFNGGVLLWRRSTASDRFFDCWHEQWRAFASIDQFALARAWARTTTPLTLPWFYNAPSRGMRNVVEAATAGVRILHFWARDQQRRMPQFARERLLDVHTFVGSPAAAGISAPRL